MIKEVLTGSVIALLVFLAWTGYDVLPIAFFSAMLLALLFLMPNKGFGSMLDANFVKESTVKFKDIGGQEAAKKELIEALDFLLKSDQTEKLGIRPLKGILLTGPPGTGKTMLAKAAANYTDAVFLSVCGSEFVEVYAGVGAQRVRNLFKQVTALAKKQKKPRGVIFIDELEVLGGKRGAHSSHLEYDQTLNQLLVELDGIKHEEDMRILLVAATNRADMLDPALLRPGRFDRQVKVELPDVNGRLEILKLHSCHKPRAEDVDLVKLAKETYGFSGAHLESVCNEAAILALRDNSLEITQSHFTEAVDKVMLGEKLDRRPSPQERCRIAVHEVGHAIMSEMIRAGSVSVLTINSRSNALGYTRQIPETDAYLYTKEDLEKQIRIALGGAVAEEVIFGQRSTGANGDFEEAVRLAKIIIDSGLSSLGIISINDLSPRDRQEAIRTIISAQETNVRETLDKEQSQLKLVADKLLTKERIEGHAFRDMLGKTSKAS